MEWCILTSFEKQSMSKWWFRHFKDPKNTCLPVVGHGTTFLTNVRVQILKNASNRDFIAMFTFSNHLNRLRSFKMLQSLVSSLTRSNTCNGHARCKRSIWSKQSSVTLQFFFFLKGIPFNQLQILWLQAVVMGAATTKLGHLRGGLKNLCWQILAVCF